MRRKLKAQAATVSAAGLLVVNAAPSAAVAEQQGGEAGEAPRQERASLMGALAGVGLGKGARVEVKGVRGQAD